MKQTYLKWSAFVFAWRGIRIFFNQERHARVHTIASLIVLSAAGLMRLQPSEWLWILWSIALVWITEIFNSALEAALDRTAPEIHPLIAKSKDLAAGAVLMAALFAFVTALIIFIPKII